MLEEIYNNQSENQISTSFEAEEALASYKLKTVLKHLNMSTFDYDIQKDTIYIRKDSVLLQEFTTYWFSDGGHYLYLENLTERLQDIVRSSFLEVTRQEIENVRNNTSGEMITFDAPIIYEGGNTRWANFVLDTMVDEEGIPTHAIGYCKDIHEQKKELYRLRKVAQTDSLTGFRNRASGMYRIQTRLIEQKDATSFFAVIDLDKFKEANDLFGHSFGDLILKNVSERMQNFVDHETVCCRTGGDEFLFFRVCDDSEHAIRLMTELKRSLEHKVSYQGSQFEVKASIGVSVYPTHGTEFDELYNKADIAMYYAKNNGTDIPVIYEDTMDSIRK